MVLLFETPNKFFYVKMIICRKLVIRVLTFTVPTRLSLNSMLILFSSVKLSTLPNTYSIIFIFYYTYSLLCYILIQIQELISKYLTYTYITL